MEKTQLHGKGLEANQGVLEMNDGEDWRGWIGVRMDMTLLSFIPPSVVQWLKQLSQCLHVLH